MEQSFKLIDGEFTFTYLSLHIVLSALHHARQRDADDTLGMYIPKSVVLWYDGRKIALDIYSDEFWTSEYKSLKLIHL